MQPQENHLVPVRVLSTPDSIGETVADLKHRGYQIQFRREATYLRCFELGLGITPEDFTVDEYYYFEDRANTDRERILYAVSSTQGLKGFVVDACFVYEDNISAEMSQKLKV